MSELERVRIENDVHLSRGHLRAAAVGAVLACATSFFLGMSFAGRHATPVVVTSSHGPREDLVELLARVEASDEVRDGVETFTFPEALTQSSGGTVAPGDAAPEGRFRVELGSFSDVAEARRLHDQLREAGVPVWVGVQLQAGVMRWRVETGAFDTEAEASAHVTSLADVLAGLGARPEIVAH